MKLAIVVIFALVCHMAIGDQVGKVCADTTTFWDGTKCSPCPANCTNCVGKGTATAICINCASGFFLSAADGTCTACIGNCTSCRGPAAADCITPAAGYQASAAGVFKCDTSATGGCLVCGSDNNCSKCTFGYRMENGKCTPCSTLGCADCSDSVSTCKKCSYWSVSNTTGNTTTCTFCQNCKDCPCTSCEAGAFAYDATAKTCTACSDTNCLACSAKDTCTSCKPGFFVKEGKCQACSNGCTTCSDDKTCTACAPKMALVSAACVPCSANCDTCTDSNTCTACSAGAFMNTDKKTCSACSAGCTACTDANTCSACLPHYVLNDKKTCDACSTGCDTCTNPTTCSKCLPGYNTDGANGCYAIKSCARGQQLDNNKTCSAGTIDNCAWGVSTPSCYECGAAFTGSSDGKCQTCPAGCSACSVNNNYLNCTTLAQTGYSVASQTSNGDKTGYLGTDGVATVQPNGTAQTCMPTYYVGVPKENMGNKQCVTQDKCTYPIGMMNAWACVLEGKTAVTLAVSLFSVAVTAIFTL